MGSAFFTGVGDGSAFDARGGDGEVVAVNPIEVDSDGVVTSIAGVGVGVGSGSGAVLGMTYETPCLDVGTHCS